jgi:hypothetical protein
MESIHVPARVLQRVAAVVKWIVPYVVAGIIALLGFGYRWIESRASREYVGEKVGEAVSGVKTIEANAFHATSLADAHERQLAALWLHAVTTDADLIVYREHGRAAADPAKRGPMIEAARRFYLREYEVQLRTHANDPAEAARLALLAPWRPE